MSCIQQFSYLVFVTIVDTCPPRHDGHRSRAFCHGSQLQKASGALAPLPPTNASGHRRAPSRDQNAPRPRTLITMNSRSSDSPCPFSRLSDRLRRASQGPVAARSTPRHLLALGLDRGVLHMPRSCIYFGNLEMNTDFCLLSAREVLLRYPSFRCSSAISLLVYCIV